MEVSRFAQRRLRSAAASRLCASCRGVWLGSRPPGPRHNEGSPSMGVGCWQAFESRASGGSPANICSTTAATSVMMTKGLGSGGTAAIWPHRTGSGGTMEPSYKARHKGAACGPEGDPAPQLVNAPTEDEQAAPVLWPGRVSAPSRCSTACSTPSSPYGGPQTSRGKASAPQVSASLVATQHCASAAGGIADSRRHVARCGSSKASPAGRSRLR
mmetsp:Transcript_116552/g.376301  ORF Transcript_116552/g.376301 Transcript_116552/m.376301 type:complete len:214 (-) Transcript_116552:351-992(-)